MRSRALVAGVAVAASLAVSACGSQGAPTMLDTTRVERAIERSSLSQRGQRARAICPLRVRQEEGQVFSCTAVVKRADTRFVVTVLNQAGRVHYEAR
jgi:hypothetical protein